MRGLFRSLAALCAFTLFAGPAAAQQPLEASLSFVSEPGDYIGAGESRLFTLDSASFSVQGGQNGGRVGVTVFPFAGGFWFLDLAAPQGSQLLPGSYEGAVRYPFQSASQPGLSLSGDGRGCNTLTGRFTVLESTFGTNGYIERFHATFEQHCEGGSPALFGEVRLVNPPPPPPLGITLMIDSVGRVERHSGSTRITGLLSCTVSTNVGVSGVLTQRLTRSALATASAFMYLPCSPTAVPVTLEFTPQGNVPFGGGMAQLDLTSSAYDPYYGNFVNTWSINVIRLLPAR